jgi:hypothetical protein
MLSFALCDSVWSLWMEAKMSRYFCFVYICIAVGGSIYQDREDWDPLAGFPSPQLCVCYNPVPKYPSAYVHFFFVFSDFRWELVVHFADIVGIVDCHCLNIFQNYWYIIVCQNVWNYNYIFL